MTSEALVARVAEFIRERDTKRDAREHRAIGLIRDAILHDKWDSWCIDTLEDAIKLLKGQEIE